MAIFRNVVLLVLLLWTSSIVSAIAGSNPGPVNFSYSWVTFAGQDGFSTVEFSYAFAENGLTYVNGVGQIFIELQFITPAGTLQDSYMWGVTHPLPSQQIAGRMVVGVKRLDVQPGLYTVNMKIVDGADAKRGDSTHFTLNVRSLPEDKFSLSDIELITEMAPVEKTAPETPFQRNGYTLMRNVDGVVTTPDFRLNSYLEIYNPHTLSQPEFTLSYLIADSTGKGLYRRDTLLSRSDGVLFDVNSVVVNGLATGWYLLAARLFDGPRQTARDSVEVIRSFYVYNPRLTELAQSWDDIVSDDSSSSSASSFIDPIYTGLKEEELDVEYRKASFIMNETRKNIWKQLSGVKPKGRFLTRFWLALDEDPATPENPFRDDYYTRIAQARTFYSSAMHPDGWDSDRGRVLLQYGKPDQIERHPSDHNRKPFEKWMYSSRSFEFDFVDRSQTGNYQLVNSTAPGEIAVPNWEGEYAAMDKYMYEGEFNNTSGSLYRE